MTHALDTLFRVTPKAEAVAVQWDLRDLVQCIAFTEEFFYHIYIICAGNIFLRLAHTRNIKETLFFAFMGPCIVNLFF